MNLSELAILAVIVGVCGGGIGGAALVFFVGLIIFS